VGADVECAEEENVLGGEGPVFEEDGGLGWDRTKEDASDSERSSCAVVECLSRRRRNEGE